jgi:hypothetical protein
MREGRMNCAASYTLPVGFCGLRGGDAKSNAYHSKGHVTLRRFFRFAPLFLFEPLLSLAAYIAPILTLLPFGPSGTRHWNARNSLYAVQTLMLAAAARRPQAPVAYRLSKVQRPA